MLTSLESIADQTRRPLVTLHSGQIIGTSPFVERRLENILSLVTRWNAVVLLDEADVFMQERAVHELERNALVSSEYCYSESAPSISLT